jgi:hypothetical protein
LTANSSGDIGDLVFKNFAGAEVHRLYDGASGTLGYRNNGGTTYAMLHSGNYTNYAPSLGGLGANGTWGINVSGTAGSTSVVSSNDIVGRDGNAIAPNTTVRQVRYDFVNAPTVGAGGNYAGVMTYAPWDGNTVSAGDATYQLAFGSTAANGGGVPMLRIRKGIDTTWNSWYDVITTANFSSYGVNRSGDSMLGSLNYCHAADIASSSTVVLNGIGGNYVNITGNTNISRFTLDDGAMRVVRFTSTLTLLGNASLVLPGGMTKLAVASGDIAVILGDTGSVSRVIVFQRANGGSAGLPIEVVRSLTASATPIDLAAGDAASVFRIAVSSNTSLTFSNLPDTTMRSFTWTVITINDATAGRALSWGNTIKWAGGQPPNRTTAAFGVDIYKFFLDNGILYGSLTVLDAH